MALFTTATLQLTCVFTTATYLQLIYLFTTATYGAYFTTATWCRQWEDAMALHVVKLKSTHEIYVYGWECSWVVTALVWYGCIAGVHCSLRPHTLVA